MHIRLTLIATLMMATTACNEPVRTPQEVLENLGRYAGSTVTIEAKVKGGVRCKLETEGGKWQTYCGDCQQCEGPLVIDMGQEDLNWPMVVMGTYEGERVGCTGKLNSMKCGPLEPGQSYKIHGLLQDGKPPRLLLKSFEPSSK